MKGICDQFECDVVNILKYPDYDYYLEKEVIRKKDIENLRNKTLARKLAGLGIRNDGFITEEEFNERRQRVLEYMASQMKTRKPRAIANLRLADERLIHELAVRETSNHDQIILTIIYVRVKYKRTELCGFIDFRHRLKSNMDDFFTGKRKLYPKTDDIVYFDWNKRESRTNDSENIECLFDKEKGLLFRHKLSYHIINPNLDTPGKYTRKIALQSPQYADCFLLDHAIRHVI